MVHESLRIINEEHAALAAMLRSTVALVEHGPGENPENFFQVLPALLAHSAGSSRIRQRLAQLRADFQECA